MKIIRFLGNVLWFFTFGLMLFLSEIFACVFSIVTIIPIFFGIPKVHLTNAKFVIAPFGKRVETHFDEAIIRNVISLIFGGFFAGLTSIIAGVIFCITIVGIPLGKVMFGTAKLSFAPFHAKIIKK